MSLVYRLLNVHISPPLLTGRLFNSSGLRWYTRTAICHNDTPQENNLGVMKGLSCFKDGPDPVVKPDSKYPEWLWKLNEPLVPLEELPKTDKKYWKRLNTLKIKQQNMIRKQKKV